MLGLVQLKLVCLFRFQYYYLVNLHGVDFGIYACGYLGLSSFILIKKYLKFTYGDAQ